MRINVMRVYYLKKKCFIRTKILLFFTAFEIKRLKLRINIWKYIKNAYLKIVCDEFNWHYTYFSMKLKKIKYNDF